MPSDESFGEFLPDFLQPYQRLTIPNVLTSSCQYHCLITMSLSIYGFQPVEITTFAFKRLSNPLSRRFENSIIRRFYGMLSNVRLYSSLNLYQNSFFLAEVQTFAKHAGLPFIKSTIVSCNRIIWLVWSITDHLPLLRLNLESFKFSLHSSQYHFANSRDTD